MAKKTSETVQAEVAASIAAAKPGDVVMIDPTLSHSLPDIAAAPVVKILQCCGTCTKHWRKLHGVPSWGECMLVAKARPSPELTPDKASCSAWGEA